MTDPFLSLIIPARNEARRLPRTLEQVADFVARQPFSVETLIVINASTDRSLGIATEFARRHPNLSVISEELPGKGRAVRKGMLAAQGSYRFFADADFSMPVDEILRFIPPVLDVPIAIASREAPGAIRYQEPAYRHFTGRVFTSLIRSLVLPTLSDTQCGFKMFRADAADALFRRQTLMGWSFDVELLYIANRMRFPIVEIPIPWTYNPESKVNIWRDSWRMFLDLLTIRRNERLGFYA